MHIRGCVLAGGRTSTLSSSEGAWLGVMRASVPSATPSDEQLRPPDRNSPHARPWLVSRHRLLVDHRVRLQEPDENLFDLMPQLFVNNFNVCGEHSDKFWFRYPIL